MNNPFLAEVTRGQLVESRHRGSVSVVDADGGRGVFDRATWTGRVFPRSAVKALQALPLDRERHRRAIRAYRRGDRARLRLPYGRAGHVAVAEVHAGKGGAGCILPRMRHPLAV